MKHASTDALLRKLRREVEREHRTESAAWGLSCAAVLAVFPSIFLIYYWFGYQAQGWAILSILALLFVPLVLIEWRGGELTRRQQKIRDLLHQLHSDPRALGLVARMIVRNMAPAHEHTLYLYQTMESLLGHTQSSDFQALSNADRKAVLEILDLPLHPMTGEMGSYSRPTPREKQVLFALFPALVRIGDKHAIPSLKRWGEQTQESDIQSAAQDCLHALQAQADHQKKKQTLLRPSSAAEAEQETLLHPAGPVINHEPAQLLRPSDAD